MYHGLFRFNIECFCRYDPASWPHILRRARRRDRYRNRRRNKFLTRRIKLSSLSLQLLQPRRPHGMPLPGRQNGFAESHGHWGDFHQFIFKPSALAQDRAPMATAPLSRPVIKARITRLVIMIFGLCWVVWLRNQDSFAHPTIPGLP